MESIEKTREYREKHSLDKKNLAHSLLNGGEYQKAFEQAYLSIFYSARMLLVGKGADSDDINTIMNIADKFFDPSGWLSVDVIDSIKEGKKIRDRLNSNTSETVSHETAARFVDLADKLYDQAKKSIG